MSTKALSPKNGYIGGWRMFEPTSTGVSAADSILGKTGHVDICPQVVFMFRRLGYHLSVDSDKTFNLTLDDGVNDSSRRLTYDLTE